MLIHTFKCEQKGCLLGKYLSTSILLPIFIIFIRSNLNRYAPYAPFSIPEGA